jgi:hypothetical protein
LAREIQPKGIRINPSTSDILPAREECVQQVNNVSSSEDMCPAYHHAYPHEGIVVVEGDRSRGNRLFFILLDFSLIIIVVLMQIANFCKQNYLAMTHVDNWWITFFVP